MYRKKGENHKRRYPERCARRHLSPMAILCSLVSQGLTNKRWRGVTSAKLNCNFHCSPQFRGQDRYALNNRNIFGYPSKHYMDRTMLNLNYISCVMEYIAPQRQWVIKGLIDFRVCVECIRVMSKVIPAA